MSWQVLHSSRGHAELLDLDLLDLAIEVTEKHHVPQDGRARKRSDNVAASHQTTSLDFRDSRMWNSARTVVRRRACIASGEGKFVLCRSQMWSNGNLVHSQPGCWGHSLTEK